MPRSRRRHHSRSRSRSRSHSHDRDREPKRRKIDSVDSPAHKRSVSCEPQTTTKNWNVEEKCEQTSERENSEMMVKDETSKIQELEISGSNEEQVQDDAKMENDQEDIQNCTNTKIQICQEENTTVVNSETVKTEDVAESKDDQEIETKHADTLNDENEENQKHEKQISETNELEESNKSHKSLEEKLLITPKKAMSPKQLQKKLESEKKRKQKQQEREERERKRQEEKERARQEKQKQKQEKEEQKQKERELKEEQKRREREEKEAKRKEREEREEQKRKEREQEKLKKEQEKLKKQQELEEKNKEKQKQEEQKQKAAAAFVNFFVPKKPLDEKKIEDGKISNFMPFQVKSDMKLAPMRRPEMTDQEKNVLINYLSEPDEKTSYLTDLKNGKKVGKCVKTWPYEEDVAIIEEDFGESICEDKPKMKKMRSKFLKFHENQRPPYYGTWRKKSSVINPRKPFVEDKSFFDYEVDSDDDWEEEEQGESLNGSDDEEKENEVENDDYEVDNEFFVPHGHLSDDEMDDESMAKLSPESHKQKLKLLKDEFDQDMQMKTHKMKPRSIGCIWYNKDGSNVEKTIDRHLKPLAMITNGKIIIKKRKTMFLQAPTPVKKYAKELREDLIPSFLKLIHGNTSKRTSVVDDFVNSMQKDGLVIEVSKAYLKKLMRQFAQWKKCSEEGPMFNKFCWCVEDDVRKKYNCS